MTWGKFYWPYWLIVASLMFLVPEIITLFTNSKNTLSDWSWTELNIYNGRIPVHGIAWWVSLIAFLTGIIVLVLHVWFHKLI